AFQAPAGIRDKLMRLVGSERRIRDRAWSRQRDEQARQAALTSEKTTLTSAACDGRRGKICR
ncbi:hypothetical protein AAHH80_36390, partial [Burkholderia pseudomallei]